MCQAVKKSPEYLLSGLVAYNLVEVWVKLLHVEVRKFLRDKRHVSPF